MINKKALVLDIDGTLTNSKKEITPITKAALERVMKAGHAVILASGRPTPGMRKYEKELGLDINGGYLLSYNGARVTDCLKNEVIYQKTLPMEIPAQIYDFAKARNVGVISYEKGCVLSAFEPDEYVLLEAKINGIPIKVVPDFPTYINFPVNKCLITAPDEIAAKYEKELQGIYGDSLSIYRSEAFFLEIMPNSVSKADTLDVVLPLIGVSRENTVCCGDGYNDISMIKYAGVGVAMANAKQEVKEAADFVTLSNDEDGLVQVVEKFILND